MRKHLVYRIIFFFIGILLFYAPFALLTHVLIYLTDSPLVADCHRICPRMPIQWMVQPWMYPTMIKQPMYLVSVLILPGIALFLGPLFCGWLCPAGSFTEFLGKLVPDKIKLNFHGKINPSPIRYGFLVGLMAVPFMGGNACCAFCNFAHMQGLVSAVFGDFYGLTHWASFTIVTFVLWFFVLGIFTKGGRGWCNLICPAGAMQGLLHSIGMKLKFGRGIKINSDLCGGCGSCVSVCPAWAIKTEDKSSINSHACNTCMDCIHVCPKEAIKYGRK